MLKFLQILSRWLANYTSFFVIGIAVFTFFLPHTFDGYAAIRKQLYWALSCFLWALRSPLKISRS